MTQIIVGILLLCFGVFHIVTGVHFKKQQDLYEKYRKIIVNSSAKVLSYTKDDGTCEVTFEYEDGSVTTLTWKTGNKAEGK